MSVRRAASLLAGALASAGVVAATTFPQTVEIDLIFPRNETYAPSAVFPVVFALQNPALVPSLDPVFDLQLWQNIAHNGTLDLPAIDLGSVNFTNTTNGGPLYVYTYALNINTTNNGADASTPYNLAWHFSAGNCSASDSSSTEASSFGGGFVFSNVVFTIAKEGGVVPSIDTTDANACKGLSYLAFNLTGTLTVPNPTKQWDGHASCAVFSETTPTPVSGNQCAATADASVAASISAAATSKACSAESPAISCPTTSTAVLGAAPMTALMVGAWTVLAVAMAL